MTSRVFVLRSVALAALMAASGVQGAITYGGATGTWSQAAIGPGDTDLGLEVLHVGIGGAGWLRADNASLLRAGSLVIGTGGSAPGDGSVLLTGAGTRIELVGEGRADLGMAHRLEVGQWGRGALTVADGALLNATVDANACLGLDRYCYTYLGNAAGSDATLTVTGHGSQVNLIRTVVVGHAGIYRNWAEGTIVGVVGGQTTGRMRVLDGAVLITDEALLGTGPGGEASSGSERSFAEASVAGTGSVWRVIGSALDGRAAHVGTANHQNAWATLAVREGGSLRMEGDGSAYVSLNLTAGGGRTDALVTGAGSNITFASQSGVLQVGRSLGSATLDLHDGALVDNVWYTSVGRDGSFGTLNIDGATTLYRANGTATAVANGTAGVASFDIGRGGGNGTVNVSNGARLELLATAATPGAPHFSLGRDAASAGTLNIGSGGTVLLSAASVAPGTAGEAWNPFLRVGRDGSGTLNISGGGKLLVEGHARCQRRSSRAAPVCSSAAAATARSAGGASRRSAARLPNCGSPAPMPTSASATVRRRPGN